MTKKRGKKGAPARAATSNVAQFPRPHEPRIPLRTVGDLVRAHEILANDLLEGRIDPKQAIAMNAVLRGSTYLNAKLKMDQAKLMYNMAVHKITMPQALLPNYEETEKGA